MRKSARKTAKNAKFVIYCCRSVTNPCLLKNRKYALQHVHDTIKLKCCCPWCRVEEENPNLRHPPAVAKTQKAGLVGFRKFGRGMVDQTIRMGLDRVPPKPVTTNRRENPKTWFGGIALDRVPPKKKKQSRLAVAKPLKPGSVGFRTFGIGMVDQTVGMGQANWIG